jgi:hypothetical protein
VPADRGDAEAVLDGEEYEEEAKDGARDAYLTDGMSMQEQEPMYVDYGEDNFPYFFGVAVAAYITGSQDAATHPVYQYEAYAAVDSGDGVFNGRRSANAALAGYVGANPTPGDKGNPTEEEQEEMYAGAEAYTDSYDVRPRTLPAKPVHSRTFSCPTRPHTLPGGHLPRSRFIRTTTAR